MKKRIFALLLAAAAVVGTTGCGDSADKGKQADGGSSDSIYEVVMQVPVPGDAPSGTQDVEDAVNAITEKEIGVKVKIEPVSLSNLVSESNLTLTSKEKLDLLCILPWGGGLDTIANYTSKNMLLQLDDLYEEYGKDIQGTIGELINIGYLGGKLYAIPPVGGMGTYPAFVARQDILDELNITIDENKIYTLDELAEMFDSYAAQAPDGNYCIASFGSGDLSQNILLVDTLGGDTSNGVLLNGGLNDELSVVNLYATDEYRAYAERMRSWKKKGFFSPDVTTLTDDTTSLMSSGKYFGTFAGISVTGLDAMESNTGYELTPIMIGDGIVTTGSASLNMWAIPASCENPEKTMQFLNMMYQDRELAKDIDSILTCGLEGKTYKIAEQIEGSKAIVEYADASYNMMTAPWQAVAPFFGNAFTVPQFTPLTSEIYDAYDTYNQKLIDSGRVSKAFGYTFDPSNVSTEKAAVQAVVSQYLPLINYGEADVDEILPEFIGALENAQIDKVVAENQKQLDEWSSLSQ